MPLKITSMVISYISCFSTRPLCKNQRRCTRASVLKPCSPPTPTSNRRSRTTSPRHTKSTKRSSTCSPAIRPSTSRLSLCDTLSSSTTDTPPQSTSTASLTQELSKRGSILSWRRFSQWELTKWTGTTLIRPTTTGLQWHKPRNTKTK